MKTRVAIIAFFLGINLILGSYFLMTVRGANLVPSSIQDIFFNQGFVQEKKTTFPLGEAPDYSVRIDLSSTAVTTAINDQRESQEESAVIDTTALHEAAEIILNKVIDNNFVLSDSISNELLKEALTEAKYSYASAYQSIIVGPVTSGEVIEYWFNNNQQETILNPDVTEIGVATTVETVDGAFTGVTVVLLAEPRGVTQVPSERIQPPPSSKPALPMVSDQEVIDALNNYRQVHGKHTLNVHPNLCSYAEKRVQDLVAYGGLDNHQGFQKDFEDPENLPEIIKSYPGTKIGENLAHQFCRNMTTGDSFVAETGVAIIEWCFDSSTKGHREAQLSSEFSNVCVRHGDGMYVVIFGN